ncbi:hypothetical protein [Spirosoma oryzae]|nr:hypothetical protein [Spirosoma oryzae]
MNELKPGDKVQLLDLSDTDLLKMGAVLSQIYTVKEVTGQGWFLRIEELKNKRGWNTILDSKCFKLVDPFQLKVYQLYQENNNANGGL